MLSHATAVAHLSRLPLLAGLGPDLLAGLADAMVWREVKKRDSVILKNSAGEHLLFLVQGRLQVLDVTESGREIGLNLLLPGDYFGEISVIDDLPRSASVVAAEACLIGLLPKAQSLALFHQNPLVAERILKGLAKKLRTASIYQTILCLPNAQQRVFALLQRLCSVAPGGLVVVEQAPKQQELAIMANTSRETVSRAFKVLTDAGVVEKDNHRLIVRKPRQLEALALQDVMPERKRPAGLPVN